MAPTLLIVHSWMRWLVLATAVVVVLRFIGRYASSSHWTAVDRRAALIFTIVLDVQLTLGLILYGVSPLVRPWLSDMGGAMKLADVRFVMVEHPTFMILAVAVAHVGSVMASKAGTDRGKFRRAATGFTVSLALILGGIPWSRFIGS